MVSRVGISENAPPSPTSVLKPPVWLNDSYVHEQLKISLHMLSDGIDHQSVSCDSTDPSPTLLVSGTKRNGLLKSPKASTGALNQVFRDSKASNVFSMSITHSFFLLVPSSE